MEGCKFEIPAKNTPKTPKFQLLRVRGRYSNFKQCTKCKEYLPATGEYFRVRIDGYGDGFYNYCRKCETKR